MDFEILLLESDVHGCLYEYSEEQLRLIKESGLAGAGRTAGACALPVCYAFEYKLLIVRSC